MDYGSFAANVGTALGLGLAIGFERELRNHEAGLRTNALVSFGAALFVSLSMMIPHGENDSTRIAAQVVSGIGFLAGGVIIRDGFSIHGLNTAATLWCTAAVGVLAGSGCLLAACIGTGGILFLHTCMRPVTNRLDDWVRKFALTNGEYRMRMRIPQGVLLNVRQMIFDRISEWSGVVVNSVQILPAERPDDIFLVCDVSATDCNDASIERLSQRIAQIPGVASAGWERRGG
jgi:putative Mg2+ transporter-C (MgtC) family protein